MQWLVESLRQHPEVALFLVLALGNGMGGLRIGSFKLGSVLGVLIAGIVVGQLDIPISESLKNALFKLFLFAIGYRTGPQFFHSLRATGLRQIILTLVVCATAITMSALVARVMGFDAGEAGGLLAGAMTGSAAFGAASGTIERLSVPEASRQLLLASGAVSFAVCYLIGTVLVIWLLPKLGPRILRVDLAESCRELEQEMGLPEDEAAVSPANVVFVTRAYYVPEPFDGKSVLELEAGFTGHRVFVERLRRDGVIVRPAGDERLRAGDRVALSGRRGALIGVGNTLSEHEVEDGGLLNIGVISGDIIVTRPDALRTLGELARAEIARGVFLRKLVRLGKELPYTLQTPVEPGDVLCVTGEKSQVNRVAAELGYVRSSTDATDMTNVTAAIFLGAVLGLPALAFGGVEVSLTLFVGVLLGGLVLGWLGSRYPRFGAIPAPALWLFDALGLAGFLALVGMQAGPGFVRGLQESGVALLAAAVLVATVPHVVGILVGRYLLRMHPGVILGACAGAGTSAPALGALLEAARSRVPALSYGVGYALGNVILATGGSLIVRFIGPG